MNYFAAKIHTSATRFRRNSFGIPDHCNYVVHALLIAIASRETLLDVENRANSFEIESEFVSRSFVTRLLASFHSTRSNYQIFHLSKDIFFFFSTQDGQFLENIASIFLLAEK